VGLLLRYRMVFKTWTVLKVHYVGAKLKWDHLPHVLRERLVCAKRRKIVDRISDNFDAVTAVSCGGSVKLIHLQ
jgi:hypothetical protein